MTTPTPTPPAPEPPAWAIEAAQAIQDDPGRTVKDHARIIAKHTASAAVSQGVATELAAQLRALNTACDGINGGVHHACIDHAAAALETLAQEVAELKRINQRDNGYLTSKEQDLRQQLAANNARAAEYEKVYAQLAQAAGDTARLDWLDGCGHDYGKVHSGSSIKPCRQWVVGKGGHGGNLRQAIDAARASASGERKETK